MEPNKCPAESSPLTELLDSKWLWLFYASKFWDVCSAAVVKKNTLSLSKFGGNKVSQKATRPKKKKVILFDTLPKYAPVSLPGLIPLINPPLL